MSSPQDLERTLHDLQQGTQKDVTELRDDENKERELQTEITTIQNEIRKLEQDLNAKKQELTKDKAELPRIHQEIEHIKRDQAEKHAKLAQITSEYTRALNASKVSGVKPIRG